MVVATVCRSLLFTGIALLLWGILPALVGFQTTVIMSGSMSPKLQVGDAVVVRKIDPAALVPGLVLLFDDPDRADRLRMHRLVAMDDSGLTTRGDANEDVDSAHVPWDAVHGAGFLRVPFAGLPEFWIRTGQPVPLVLAAAGGLVLFAGARLCRLLEDPEPRQRGRHRGTRLPGGHRAVATVAAMLVLAGGAVAADPQSAHAAFSTRTTNPVNRWTSGCADSLPSGLAASTRFYWGYGPPSATAVQDLGSRNDGATLLGTAVKSGCADKTRPYATVGASGPGVVLEGTRSSLPGAMTVATWFRTSTPGGVLADFGSSTGLQASTQIDRALYMRGDGNLVFGGTTISLLGGSLGKVFCATSGAGFADGGWHLVVATWSSASRCSLTVDNGTAVTNGPPLGLSLGVLSGYTGAWRFGYDVLDATWTGASGTAAFVGDLDETQAYSEASTGLSATAWCRRRSATDPAVCPG